MIMGSISLYQLNLVFVWKRIISDKNTNANANANKQSKSVYRLRFKGEWVETFFPLTWLFGKRVKHVIFTSDGPKPND